MNPDDEKALDDAAWDAVMIAGIDGEIDELTGGVVDEDAGRVLFPGGGSMARRHIES